jgi:fatty acid/phospholipid biosynthesis enzyme
MGKTKKTKTCLTTPPAQGMQDYAGIITLLGQLQNRFEFMQQTQEALVTATMQHKAQSVQAEDASAPEVTSKKNASLMSCGEAVHVSAQTDCSCNGPTGSNDATNTSNLSHKLGSGSERHCRAGTW